MVLHLPLELDYWLINVLSGSMDIFIIISFFAIAMLAGFFNFSRTITLVMFAVFLLALSPFVGTEWMVILLLLVLNFFAYQLGKLIRK